MRKYILTSVVLIQLLTPAIAGNSFDDERMLVTTDRGLYVTGDKIYFSCLLLPGGAEDSVVSTIAYIELITPGGEKILGQKRTIQNGICKGAVNIPVEIVSGNYYLRAYTKVMRNRPAESFGYCLVKIVNPERSEILETNNHDTDDLHAQIETLKLSNAFQIEVDADTIAPRKKVEVKLRKKETLVGQLSQTVVSIVPAISRPQKVLAVDAAQNGNTTRGPFSAESDGLTISGIITEQDRPVPLNITLLGPKHNNFYPVKTDSSGRFSFVFSEKYGEQDLFVSFNAAHPDAEILIDNDFCSKKILFPAPAFDLNREERKFLLQAAHHQKIKRHFGMIAEHGATAGSEHVAKEAAGKTEKAPSEDAAITTSGSAEEKKLQDHFMDTIPFYGKPGHMIYIADYIQMSQVKDYLTELQVPVRIRKKRGKEMISISGVQAEMNIFPPLLMVDFAPVYDHSTVLHMDPGNVFRIDILDAPYVRGEMTYGGILNVISTNNDFAGIKLPEKGLFVNYQLLTDSNGFHNRSAPILPHIPDVRTTLYWNPSFDFEQSDTGTFRFLSGDMQGEYVIRVTGITSEGASLVSEKRIIVKQ